MISWQNVAFWGLVSALGALGCTVTSDTTDGQGGESNSGGSSGAAGESAGGSAGESGSSATAGTAGTSSPYTAAQCEASAAAEADPNSPDVMTCGQCIYTKLCSPYAVDCENQPGCIDAVVNAENCVYDEYVANGDGDPQTGFITQDQIDNCTTDAGITIDASGDLWSAIANTDNTDNCAFECYLSDAPTQ